MKRRSLILGLTFLLAGLSSYAQKGELNNAKTSIGTYEGLRSTPSLASMELQKAKTAIDKATIHEKTMNDVLTWTYRAQIYAYLATSDTVESKVAPYLAEAVKAVAKASQLDAKGEQKTVLANVNENLYGVALNRGVREYKSANYSKAFSSFEEAAGYAGPGRDTTANYFAGVSAQYAKDYPNAIKKYNALLSTKYSLLEDVYSNLSVIYLLGPKDTVSAIRISGEGAAKFPQNALLATREIEFSLMTGREKQIIDKITTQAQKDPKNKLLPYYLGIAYNATKEFSKAEEAYAKALAIDPNYANAAINMGGLIMNNGIDIYNKTNKIDYVVKGKIDPKLKASYDEGMKKATAEFDRAYPYLLKASELDRKSELALKNLKVYYGIKSDPVKLEEIQKRLDAL